MSIVYLPRTSAYGQNIKPSDGAKMYFYEAGTTTLKTPYSDTGETVPHANPVLSVSTGVWPAIYISGLYKIKITDKNDVEIYTEDNLTGRDGDVIWQGDFDSTTNSSNYPAAGNQGDMYRVTEEFDLATVSGGYTLYVGDFIICNKQGGTGIDADWEIERGKNSVQKVAKWSADNLVIKYATDATVDADADAINLLDSNNRVKQVTGVNLTFTTPTDVIGTVYASHWLQLWTDEDGLHKLVADLTGTADADVANSLSASAATFVTDLVQVGDEIYNTTDNTKGYVKAVSSETVITCKNAAGADLDLFPLGTETFTIHQLNPSGLGNYKANIGAVYVDAGGDFDDFHQIDNKVTIPVTVLGTGLNDTSFTARDASAIIPITAKELYGTITPTTTVDNTSTHRVASTSAGLGETNVLYVFSAIADIIASTFIRVVVVVPQKIYSKVDSAASDRSHGISIGGYLY